MKKHTLFGLVFTLIISAGLFISLSTFAHAATFVSEDISTDTTWTLSESPYVVTTQIFVQPEATLTVDPGVIVKFDGQFSGIFVSGTLRAQGTANAKIVFTSINDDIGGDTNENTDGSTPFAGDWGGITLFDYARAGGNVLSHVDIKYSGDYFGIATAPAFSLSNVTMIDTNKGVDVDQSTGSISNLRLENIGGSALTIWGGSTVAINGLTELNIQGEGMTVFDLNTRVTAQNVSFDIIARDGITIFSGGTLNLSEASIKNIQFGGGLEVFDNGIFTGDKITFDTGIFDGIDVFSTSTMTLTNSTVQNFNGDGVADFSGPNTVTIHGSVLTKNLSGINIYAGEGVYDISGNSISGNVALGANTYIGTNVPLSGNWWGDASGPLHPVTNSTGLGSSVSDGINFTPWLTVDPNVTCCSSVIFVPGFEGSRLYEKRNNGSLIQRWEPGIASLTDIRSLFLNTAGSSLKNIITKDVIEVADYPILDTVIYKSFADLLRLAKNTEKINNFFLFPYDWRFDVDNLARNGSQTDAGVLKLKDKIIELAESSKTGKVALVGHSNGGLLIKKTVALLKETGQEGLVDKLILVGSPQLGTPGALTSILHGDDTTLGFGLVLTPEDAREWAQNMPGAYALLPSEKLYQKMGSFINFDSLIKNNWFSLYGEKLDYNEQRSFLLGFDGRNQPKRDDLEHPTILRKSILDKAVAIHNEIDVVTIPENISIYEIAGVGRRTVQGITYRSKTFIPLKRIPKLSCDGDKTVVAESAIDYGTNSSYLNLHSYAIDMNETFSHFDIFENPEIINLISNITLGTVKLTPHITSTKPSLTECKFNIFGAHSPVNLDVYDSQGRHTGINRNQSTNTLLSIDEEIPGSDFFIVGDEKYVSVPDDGVYTIKIDGTGSGLFTFDIQSQVNDQVVAYQEYASLPVTPSLKGEIVVTSGLEEESILKLDSNGDGVFEQEIMPGTESNPLSYLEAVKSLILSLELNQRLEKKILVKLDNIAKLIARGKFDKAEVRMQKFLTKIEFGKWANKKLTQTEREELANKINVFLDSI